MYYIFVENNLRRLSTYVHLNLRSTVATPPVLFHIIEIPNPFV